MFALRAIRVGQWVAKDQAVERVSREAIYVGGNTVFASILKKTQRFTVMAYTAVMVIYGVKG